MPRHWSVRPRVAPPCLDLIEVFKTGFIWVIGAIYVALLVFIFCAGVWLYATSKAIT